MKQWLSKAKENKELIVLTVIFGMFPLVCAVVYSLLDGHAIWDIYLPASYWNDELFYFKQVEAVVNYGLPQGWFGFQEMHGSVFPFAAWNPAVLIPYIVWGFLFGWDMLSPIWANIVYNMVALAGFALIVRPTKKQSFFVLLLLATFAPYSRYLLSAMPETVFMSMGSWMVTLTVSCLRAEKTWKIAVMFGICVLITLARPYLILFMALPAWLLIRKNKWKGAVIALCITLATAVGYFVMSELCSSPYVIPLIETDWLNSMKNDGLFAGIGTLFDIVWEKFKLLIKHHFVRGFRYGLLSGALHTVAGTLAFFLGARWLWSFRKKKQTPESSFWLIHFVITAGMLVAIFLFYPIADGAKHWMIFIVMGMIWIALLNEKFNVMKIVTALLCTYLFIVKAFAPFDWQAPYDDGKIKTEMEALESQLAENMVLADTKDRFDDTVIWLANDIIDGQSVSAPWGYLYVIPEGFGINFCLSNYVLDHIDQLKSAYIAVIPGGDVEKVIADRGAEMVGGIEAICIYKLR